MNYKDELRIALPSKGRLREGMDKLFLEKGVIFKNLISDREYIGSIKEINKLYSTDVSLFNIFRKFI